MSEIESVVTIDGVDYKESELNKKQVYFMSQCKDLLNKKGKLEFDLDQIQASLNVFHQALVKETKEQADEILNSDKSEGEKK